MAVQMSVKQVTVFHAQLGRDKTLQVEFSENGVPTISAVLADNGMKLESSMELRDTVGNILSPDTPVSDAPGTISIRSSNENG